MPNGKPGDHPYTDIVLHGCRVYSERVDALVREVAALGGGDEISDRLWDEFDQNRHPDLDRLERILTEARDRLKASRG